MGRGNSRRFFVSSHCAFKHKDAPTSGVEIANLNLGEKKKKKISALSGDKVEKNWLSIKIEEGYNSMGL